MKNRKMEEESANSIWRSSRENNGNIDGEVKESSEAESKIQFKIWKEEFWGRKWKSNVGI